MKLFNFQLTRRDKVVTFSLLFIMFLFTFLTYYHFNKRVERLSSSKAIGIVRYKYNSVKRKYEGRFIWEEVKSHSPIYLNDSVLTGDRSDAIIKLNSGVEIELDPDSLVQIDTIKDSVGLKITKGVIRAKGNENESTLIETSSGLIADIRGSDVMINQGKGKNTGIYVKSGDIQIENRQGSSSFISSGKVLRLNPDGKWSLQELHIITNAPADGSLIITRTKKKKITLSWNTKLNLRSYKLHLSRKSSFRNKKVINTRKNRHTITLNEGTWYWQLFSRHKKKKVFSAMNSFTVQKYSPVEIITPENNVLLVNKPSDNVIFRWKLPKRRSTVRFYLASDPNFKNIIKSDVVAAPSYAVRNLEKGKYYWKVEPEFAGKVSEKEVAEIRTKKNTFVIDDTQQNLKWPIGLSPSSSLALPAGVDKEIRFSWARVAGASAYQIKMFLDKDKKYTLNRRLDRNYFVYQIPWETKAIDWEVTALSINKTTKLIQKSKTSKIRVNVTFKLPGPPEVLSATAKLLY